MPIANFRGVEGSMPLLAKASHINAKIGANVKIKNAFKD
tara:strand:- start:280 stop:396 length:117 start_codon:yes stop_codon:yes gene_type:complete